MMILSCEFWWTYFMIKMYVLLSYAYVTVMCFFPSNWSQYVHQYSSVCTRLSGTRKSQSSRDSDAEGGSAESLNSSKSLPQNRVGPLSSSRPNRTFELRRARTESMESDSSVSSTPRYSNSQYNSSMASTPRYSNLQCNSSMASTPRYSDCSVIALWPALQGIVIYSVIALWPTL